MIQTRRRVPRGGVPFQRCLCALIGGAACAWLWRVHQFVRSRPDTARPGAFPHHDVLSNEQSAHKRSKDDRSAKHEVFRGEVIPTAQSPYGGAFVHLGKTGGSTLSILLRNGCHSFQAHPCRNVTHETIASQLIESYYHVPDFGLLPQSQHDFYLVSTRDPLERVVSSFVYEHYWNRKARGEKMDPTKKDKFQLAYKCFPTLEQFALYFEDPTDPTRFQYPYPKQEVRADNCQDLARAALFGKVRIYGHLYFGYQRILSLLPPHRVVYVARQEHLQTDWESVLRLLQKQHSPSGLSSNAKLPVVIPLPHQRNVQNQSQHLPVQRVLSKRGARALCQALRDEYHSYITLLQNAYNLSPTQVADSVQHACNQCPQLTVLLREWRDATAVAALPHGRTT